MPKLLSIYVYSERDEYLSQRTTISILVVHALGDIHIFKLQHE